MRTIFKHFEHAMMCNPLALMIEHVRMNQPPKMDSGFMVVTLVFVVAFTWSIIELVIFLNR